MSKGAVGAPNGGPIHEGDKYVGEQMLQKCVELKRCSTTLNDLECIREHNKKHFSAFSTLYWIGKLPR